MSPIGREQRYFWTLASLILVFGVVFVARGPVRAVTGGGDLSHLYAAAVLWLDGGNPYDGQACVQVMREAGYSNPDHVANGSFYPPPTIAVLSPLGLVGWEAVRLIWLAINLVCCGGLIWALAYWLKVESASRRWMLALLILLAWGPVMTTLSLGQLSIAAAACLFAGLILLEKSRAYLPGLLLAAGCLIKPQLGLGFLVLLALRRDWLALGLAVGVIGLFTGVSVGRLMQMAPEWSSAMAANIARGQTPGSLLDASLNGPLRYQMCDLRPLLHLALPSAWVNPAAMGLIAGLAFVAIIKLIRLGVTQHHLLAISGIGLLVLLPVYHRVYDAVLLLPLLALVVEQLKHDRRDRWMALVALMMLPLFLPLPSLLVALHGKGVIPDSVHHHWLWQHGVLQHQSWCLLIAAVALVIWTCRLKRVNDDLTISARQVQAEGSA